MTKLVFFRSGGVFYGFEEQGHTGYGEEGDDVLCAALSAMTMLIINAIEVSYASTVDYTIDEKTTNIRLIAKSALGLLFMSFCSLLVCSSSCWNFPYNVSKSLSTAGQSWKEFTSES